MTAMYATCLHCNAALGRNEVIEKFPVGRRLAFDSAKGRLWVVCSGCGRWNLTPLEERWEAIEQCERLFRDTPLRSSTDNIGLARVREGVDLVRVGKPLLPEMAAWRYGSELVRRWRVTRRLRFINANGPKLSMLGTGAMFLYIGSGSAAISLVATALTMGTSMMMTHAAKRDIRARVVLPDGQVTNVRTLTTDGVAMNIEDGPGGGWALRSTRGPDSYVNGESTAARTLRGVLAYRNATGGDSAAVASAVKRLQGGRDSRDFINRVARAARSSGIENMNRYPDDVAMALEMALHDETERRALDGELAALAEEWALADEVAKIADDMFLPDSVWSRFAALKAPNDGKAP